MWSGKIPPGIIKEPTVLNGFDRIVAVPTKTDKVYNVDGNIKSIDYHKKN